MAAEASVARLASEVAEATVAAEASVARLAS